MGETSLLKASKLALFCSIQCPGRLILQTYDLAQALRDAGRTVIGGFHSPMEQECLTLLLRGKQPIVICPARSLENLRVPLAWRSALEAGRLLILSPFEAKHRRATAGLAQERNRFVAALADEVFVAYAAPGSRTEVFIREVAAWGKPLLTLDSPQNAGLLALGARPVTPDELRRAGPAIDAVPLFQLGLPNAQ